jgi:hypothetical protein
MEREHPALRALERRVRQVESELSATEAVVESYETLLDAAWGLIEELRDRCRKAGIADD